MAQYYEMKARYPEALLLYRVGDFYETFGEDAVKTAQVLGIVLTKRNNGGVDIELAGFPYHSLDLYLPRLVRAGFRVAVCEQLEKPTPGKKIVKRGVSEIVTPGVAIEDGLLDARSNNYLAAIFEGEKSKFGISLLDISTGEFLVTEGDVAYLQKILQSFQPAEILVAKSKLKSFQQQFGAHWYCFGLEDWILTYDYTREKLLTQFETNSLKGFGVEDLGLAQIAAGATLHYLKVTENNQLQHIRVIGRMEPEHYVWLDKFTVRNLELLETAHQSGASLLQILDQTVSPMGARMMRKWVVLPLKEKSAIQKRLDLVQIFYQNETLQDSLRQTLRSIGDLERLIGKVPSGKINPREVLQLSKALKAIGHIQELLIADKELMLLADSLQPLNTLQQKIVNAISEEAPVALNKGFVIAEGYHTELDNIRHLIRNSKDVLMELQQREMQRTGITSLKIGFNNVFGYYLEVTNRFKDQVPSDWTRKQTTTNAERYITPELKELEARILGAEEQSLQLEEALFAELITHLGDFIAPIQNNAQQLARMDCLTTFAYIARKYHYCKPSICEDTALDIKSGRHPVIERLLPPGESYIPNDVYLDTVDQQLLLITGPNMAGKSALLRQTALICLMAQMGSYVPATSANIGLVDKVFTRVGASDNISSGESTFMVEMTETASILNNLSERSLVLLDEIGRGTSTYDGISIAWSIAEYLHENGSAPARTLFATHYHELNELAEQYPRIHNFHVATRESGHKVHFLRKLQPGGVNHSFGIYVARIAGMPGIVVERAKEVLARLEATHRQNNSSTSAIAPGLQQMQARLQLNIFEAAPSAWEGVIGIVERMDINRMTPVEALLKLEELKSKILAVNQEANSG